MIKKYGKKIIVIALTAIMAVGCSTGQPTSLVQGKSEKFNDASKDGHSWDTWKKNWSSYSGNYEHVSLTPGVNESQLNFAWYSKTKETPKVRIGTNSSMNGAAEFSGNRSTAVKINNKQYYSNKVKATGLKENTTYYYQVYQNGSWKRTQIYQTCSFSNYSFLFVGDPQIGASRKSKDSEKTTLTGKNSVTTSAKESLAARNDSYNWNKILNNARKDHKNLSFMVTAGDQVNYSKSEREYAAYLGVDALKSLPVATTIGNHDVSSSQYSMHFNNPNSFQSSQTSYTKGKTAAGTDYYYRYGNTLFIVLDTNNPNCTTHENVIKRAISENPDTTWRTVTFHQDMYGSGYLHSSKDGMLLRTQLTPIMDKYDIDAVLQGHDHTYARSYQLESDGKPHKNYNTRNHGSYNKDFRSQNNCFSIVNKTKGGTVTNPKGTVYFEANSSTGSKFYDLHKTKYSFLAERGQSWSPTYAVVNVNDNTFSVTTYDAYTRKPLKGASSYTIKKTKKRQVLSGTTYYKKSYDSKAFSLNIKKQDGSKVTYQTSNKKIATVSNDGKVRVKGTGKAVITVKAGSTNNYSDASRQIVVIVIPAKQSISVKRTGRKKLYIRWKKDKRASGYQIKVSRSSSFKNSKTKSYTVKSYKTYKKTVGSLKSRKKYYIKVRSYKTIYGSRNYGSYSNTKKVTAK